VRRKPYPLEIVEKIRATQQTAARAALEESRVKLEFAEIVLQRARREAIDHERAKWRFETKRAIPIHGCSGADLQREASFALGLSERERLLKEEIFRAQSAYNRLRVEVDALQSALEQSHAALEAVEQHHEKFDAEQSRERANEAESESDDLNSIQR
jgi:uncharacterized protein YlxW (UPF0749 family)